ncbi:uncharacterized protein F4812DRAFT_440437 [Daldinia caldariorum]|uniref:uncharacterized protein n=1 Tax=Daldinia caldariorum TaxID=326644 RepID=UPI002008B49A|nr:uncharacterized protein F4812DRAFT_440437 [Daldinia caldariorum]KAI1464813.1 hypothetical protein F4812DRAFT_440437 [Daldinia caldariorum]
MGRSGYDTTFLWEADDSETTNSICSADTPPIEEEHPLFEWKSSFLQVVMAAYKGPWGRQQDESAVAIDSTETPFELGELERDNDGPRKRSRLSDYAPTNTGEKQSQRSFTKRRAQDRRLWLACPYAKKDPVRYRDCYRYFLARVRDVKQHVTRCHRKPIHCPICNDTFKDEDERDLHIGLRSCTPRPSIIMEGISEKQKRELSQRVSSKMPEEQQWFAVFDIIFSPHPRPRTPYRDRELSDDLCVFQDFMTARGPALLTEFLEARGVVTWNLPREERDLDTFKKEVLGEGLQLIIDQWTSDNARALEPASATHSLRSSPTLDSGIAMQSSSQRAANKRSRIDDPLGTDRHDLQIETCRDEDSYAINTFSCASSLQNRVDTSLGGVMEERNSHFITDESTEVLPRGAKDSRQEYMPETDPSTISQLDYVTTFSAADEVPDMLNFDMEWPP